MRYLVLCALAGLLAWPQSVAAQTGEEGATSTGLAIHAQHRLPPQLMLRASYYSYLDVDPLRATTVSGAASEPALKLEGDSAGVEVTPTEQTSQPRKGLSGGAKAGIAVGVILGVGLAVGAGVGVAAVRSIEVF